MKNQVFFSCLLTCLLSHPSIYLPFEHKNNLIYLNLKDKKAFNLLVNEEEKDKFNNYGSYPFHCAKPPHPNRLPKYSRDYQPYFDTYQLPNPKTSTVHTIHAKQLGLLHFIEIYHYLDNPYFYIGKADVQKEGDANALYIINYYNSTIIPIICPNVEFDVPITCKQNHLYYGFAKKENTYWVYELCTKTNKLTWFPTKITNLRMQSVEGTVLGNTKIAGHGKINKDTVLFTFDLLSKKLQTLNLNQKTIEDIYIPYTNTKAKYKSNSGIDLFSMGALAAPVLEKAWVKIKNGEKTSTFIWSLKENKLSNQPIHIPLIFSNQQGISQHNKPRNILYNIYLQKNRLIANRIDLKTGAQKNLSTLNNTRSIKIGSNDTESEDFIYCDNNRMLFNIQKNKKPVYYFADFRKKILKEIPFSSDFLKNISPLNKLIWRKDSLLFVANGNVFKLPFSSLKPKKYSFLKDIINVEKNNLYSSSVLAITNSNKLCRLNPSTNQISVLEMPQLKDQVKDQVFRPFQDNYHNFYHYGHHFIGFDLNCKKIIEYKIPYQSFDQTKQIDRCVYLSKQIQNELWMWVADTKRSTLTTLKFPSTLPKGYFNLQNYIVKQTRAIVIPNKK